MFLSHINFTFSIVALFIYFSRVRGQRFFELLLTVFTVIYSLTSGIWLAYYHYGFNHPLTIDNYGVLFENYTLIIPLFILLFIKYDIPKGSKFGLSASLILIGLFLFGVHHFLSDSNNFFLLHPNNTKYNVNLNFQIGLDFTFLVFFLYLFIKQKPINKELFDGNFKRIFGIVFIIYYVQDLIILYLLKFASAQSIALEYLYYTTLILNFIIIILLIVLGVFTNWLPIWNYIRLGNVIQIKTPDKAVGNNSIDFIPLDKLGKTGQIDWNHIKSAFSLTHSEIIDKIDTMDFLTKTEKMYAFYTKFNYNQKQLADELAVSLRTVETNFYRVRQKLKKNQHLL